MIVSSLACPERMGLALGLVVGEGAYYHDEVVEGRIPISAHIYLEFTC